MSKLELSDPARKLLERMTEEIETQTEILSAKPTTAASALSAACALMNIRARYFAQTGEHFSVQEYEGILLVDTLDERLLKGLRRLLKAYVDRVKRVPETRALEILAERLESIHRDLPQYPVGYMILFTVRQAFETFQKTLDPAGPTPLPELEAAFVHHLLGIVDRYVGTREKTLMRHFSDVAREYSVVSRLKCKCGEEKFEVKLQSLCQEKDAVPYDRLDLACTQCGHQRSITFDLPFFKDMYQA